MKQKTQKTQKTDNYLNKKSVLADFRLANLSRELSILGRREVLTGKAKFGIFGAREGDHTNCPGKAVQGWGLAFRVLPRSDMDDGDGTLQFT